MVIEKGQRPGQPPGCCRYNGWMQITLNGHPHDCGQGTTVTQLLLQAGYAGRRVAVEINHEIVPRSLHDGHELREGDQVEIVHAIGGG
jgi:sulfur carrier protein